MGLVNAQRLGTPREVAARLNCGLSTVYRLIARGVIPSITIPTTGLVRVPMERFENLLRQWESEGRRRRGRKGRNAGGLEGWDRGTLSSRKKEWQERAEVGATPRIPSHFATTAAVIGRENAGPFPREHWPQDIPRRHGGLRHAYRPRTGGTAGGSEGRSPGLSWTRSTA